jgi:serine/threonine protein kinase/tetratricopeptide (TPR) repeat protein
MPHEPKHIETLFHAARDRVAGPERQAYLDGACGDDAELRDQVEGLLAAHEEASDFLEDPAVSSPREGPGTSIGPYKLLQEIGEGGMGVVYMAEQERPVRRKVALKVIKLGMDTVQVIARFEAERQALALMDHANIARVFDAGATDTGRPYFVMELVRGVPINTYCDTHKLSTDERLELFVDVCRAVQHAHQKGIIHRDLKPTNVLVTSHDGVPVPKIIDFGVAKATNQRLTERTLFTEFHQIIGTPEYMSPEQAEMSGLDVDTRSDIYALGVLMYQLLTGTTPVDPTDLRTAGFQEMTRIIREDEPQAPSTRISKLAASGEKIANHRSRDAATLSRHFQGDLDWIVMKALEKDRTRRYETASSFAEDVLRHLGDQPVHAGPPGAAYRMRKFALRNRKAVVAALVLVAVVGLGLAGTTAGFLRARAEADRLVQISDSLQDVLAMTDASRGADRREIESVLATVREVFGENHATYAAVLDTLATRLHDAGDFDAAAELSRESLEVWKTVYGESHLNVAVTLASLGSSLRANGDDEEAESVLRAALAILEEPSNTSALAGHGVRVELADLLSTRGEYAEADELFGEALEILRASPSPAHFSIIQTLEQRAAVQLNRPSGDVRETVRAMYDEVHQFYPDDSPMRAMVALGYGRVLFQHGENETAEPYLREAVEGFGAAEPRGFYFVAAGELLFQVLRARSDQTSLLEADELLREMIEVARTFWSPGDLAKNQRYYASRMVERDQSVEALDALVDAFEVLVRAGEPADERDSLRGDLVEVAVGMAVRPGLAADICARARTGLELALQDGVDTLAVEAALGAILYRQGEYALAAEKLEGLTEPLDRASRSMSRKVAPIVHTFRALAYARLGDDALAEEQLTALRAAFDGRNQTDDMRAILREVENLIEHTQSPAGDSEKL